MYIIHVYSTDTCTHRSYNVHVHVIWHAMHVSSFPVFLYGIAQTDMHSHVHVHSTQTHVIYANVWTYSSIVALYGTGKHLMFQLLALTYLLSPRLREENRTLSMDVYMYCTCTCTYNVHVHEVDVHTCTCMYGK